MQFFSKARLHTNGLTTGYLYTLALAASQEVMSITKDDTRSICLQG